MKKARVKLYDKDAGILMEESSEHYTFQYDENYNGPPISLTLPVRKERYHFDQFPTFFDGLLPEGVQLEGMLKKYKIDKNDFFNQLLATGEDLVGAVTVVPMNSDNG